MESFSNKDAFMINKTKTGCKLNTFLMKWNFLSLAKKTNKKNVCN